eukprot:5760911-Alexandrium_andersonii.AAC.1
MQVEALCVVILRLLARRLGPLRLKGAQERPDKRPFPQLQWPSAQPGAVAVCVGRSHALSAA